MSVRQLRGDVFLPPFPGGFAVRYPAGTPIEALPAGVAQRITNPAAWVDVERAPLVEAPRPVVDALEEPVDPAYPDDVDDADGVEDEALEEFDDTAAARAAVDLDELAEPPRSGRGATDAVWRQYAAALGQVVPASAGRGEVIAQLSAAGLIESEG